MPKVTININCNDTICNDCHLKTFLEGKHPTYWCLGFNTVLEGNPVKRSHYCIENESRPLPTNAAEVENAKP